MVRGRFEEGSRIHRLAAGLLTLIAFCSVMLWPLEATAQLSSNSFSPVTWYNAGANDTFALAAGDLNNDGFADIVVTSHCYSATDCHTGIGVFINNGNGTFQPGVRYKTDGVDGGYGAIAQSVAIADVDSDGKPDLLVLNSGWTSSISQMSVSVMRGNGDGTFEAAVSFSLNLYAHTTVIPGKLTVADVDGDGKPDILVSGFVSYDNRLYPDSQRGSVSVLLNNGGGTFASAVLYDSGGYAGATDVIAADVNADGFLDIVVTNRCSTFAANPADGSPCFNMPGSIGVLLGSGNGAFQQAVSYPSGGYVPYALVPVDVNRDGKTDLLVANNCPTVFCAAFLSAASVLIGNGDGSFQQPVNYIDGADQPLRIAAGDVDGDGLVDVAVLNSCSYGTGCNFGGGPTRTLSVQLGNGDGTLQAPVLYTLWAEPGTGYGNLLNTVVVSDLNNDGKPDLVVAGWASIGVLLNQTPRAATTTTLVSQPNPSASGQAATFTATVSSSAPGTPTGTITFTEGVTVLGTAPLANAVATLDVSNLSLGSHPIVASYSSDPAFRYSVSAPLTQVVKIATTTAVSSSSNPSTVLQSVTFTATVTAQFGGAVSGNVTFNDGDTVLGSVGLSGNTAGFSTSSLAVGAHSITAEYSGDANNLGSNSAALSQSVVEATTQVTVDTSPSGLTIAADGVSDTAPKIYQWTPSSQHQLSTTEPQQVTAGSRLMFSSWSDGGAFTHSVTTPSSPATYTATFKTQFRLTTAANPPAGGSITQGDWFDSGSSVTITATAAPGYSFTGFSGDLSGTANPNSVAMNAAKTVTANFKGLTATSVSSSRNPAVAGQAVTFTALVTSTVAGRTGSVTFKDGGATLGAGALNASGQATFSTSSLAVGTHSITAAYTGDSNFLGSSSPSLSQTVTQATTTTTLTSAPNPSSAGQAVTFTATVISSTGGIPTGTVNFKDGNTVLGSSPLNAAGSAAFVTSSLSAGSHTIKAVYAGTASYSGSTSANLKQVVNPAPKAPTTTSLTSSPNPSGVGQSVTFTATVTGSGTPTGKVTFKDGGKSLGTATLSGGVAAFSTSSLKQGSHSITATYSGDSTFAGSISATYTQVVN